MEKYEITKEQVQDIYNDGCTYVKEWFPDAFKAELEAGKWYKSNYPLLIFIEEIHHSYLVGYGFNSIEEFKKGEFCRRQNDKYEVDYKSFNFKEATGQEVKTALENEAVNRGFKKGVEYLSAWNNESLCHYPKELFYNSQKNCLATQHGSNECIFQNGKWATIIQTMTKKEAEEKLGVKII